MFWERLSLKETTQKISLLRFSETLRFQGIKLEDLTDEGAVERTFIPFATYSHLLIWKIKSDYSLD